MKAVEPRAKANTIGKNSPSFSRRGEGYFFGGSMEQNTFFNYSKFDDSSIQTKLTIGQPNDKYEQEADAMVDKVVQRQVKPVTLTNEQTTAQAKCAGCTTEENMIQMQEMPDEPGTKESSPDTKQPVPQEPAQRSPRIAKCKVNPEFPDFGCLAGQLKLDIDDNLRSNAHQFYNVASLHPGDKELMWNTFMRYGLGINLLQTSFSFLGVDKKWSNVLSYGTGVAMKSYQFIQSGELKLDIPIPLGNGVNLDIKFDLNVDPNNMRDVRGVNTAVGISGRF